MKLVMDEKLKHRLVGISVILSLAVIFLPAMMRKSSQRLENNFSVNVQLPPKPVSPEVAVTNKEQMFKTINAAKIDAYPLVQKESAEKQQHSLVSEPVEKPMELGLNTTKPTPLHKEIKLVVNPPISEPVKPAQVKLIAPKARPTVQVSKQVVTPAKNKPVVKQAIYAVQLASFSQLTNAQVLIKKLESKGYKASYVRADNKQGAIYKVYVGHSPSKEKVLKLKTQLASAMQLNGLVVNTGVS